MEELIIMVEYWWNSGGIWKQWRNINVIVPMKTNHIFTGMIAVSSPEANKEGVWFEYKGEMLVTGEKWTIVVEVNLTETRREIAELRGRTEDTAFLLTQAAEKLPSLGVQIKVLQRIMSMEDELMEIVQTLSDLYYGRSRRGLINLGGKILHVLFGVAENEDLEQVQHSEDLTKMKTASLIHIEEEHLTVTRELSRKAERNHQELGRVSQEVYENITSLMNHFLTTNRKTAELDNLLHVYMNTSTALEELELATFKALLDLRKIVQCLNDAANDKLSMNLISPLELRKILLKVRSSLPSGLELVFGTDISTVLKFYQLIKTCAVTSGEVIKILLTVPLSSIGRRFDMFQALALPVKNFHTNVTVRYQLDSSILLFSKDRDRYSTLQEAMLDQCNQVGSLTLCPAFSPLYARHEPSCLSSLFLGEVRLAQQHCTRLVLTKDPPDAWVWRQSDNSWIYSLSAERRFVSQCKAADQTTVEELTLHGTGVMQAIKGCTLSHPSYQIPAPTSLGGRTKVRLRPVAIDLPAALSLAGGRFSSSQIRLELARRQHQGHVWPGTSGVEEITIDNLFRSLQAMEAAEPTDELMNHWYYATAAVLVMALAGSAAAWKLYWKKAASTPSDDAEKESVPDPEVKTAQTVSVSDKANKKVKVPTVIIKESTNKDKGGDARPSPKGGVV